MKKSFFLALLTLSFSVRSENSIDKMRAFFAVHLEVASFNQNSAKKTVLQSKTFCTKKALIAKDLHLGVVEWKIHDARKYAAILGIDMIIRSTSPKPNSSGNTFYGDGSAFVDVIDYTHSTQKVLGRSPLGVSEINFSNTASSFSVLLSEDEASLQKLYLIVRSGSARYDVNTNETFLESFFKNEGEQAKLSLENCELL